MQEGLSQKQIMQLQGVTDTVDWAERANKAVQENQSLKETVAQQTQQIDELQDAYFNHSKLVYSLRNTVEDLNNRLEVIETDRRKYQPLVEKMVLSFIRMCDIIPQEIRDEYDAMNLLGEMQE